MKIGSVRALSITVSLCVVGACGVRPTGVTTGSTSGSDELDLKTDVALFSDDTDAATAALPTVPGELLVQPFPGADPGLLAVVYSSAGAEVIDELPEIDLVVLQVGVDSLDVAAKSIVESGLIETIQRNRIYEAQAVPDDPMFSRQGFLEQVNAPAAWDESVGDESVVIAIVDSGVELDHPDLEDKLIDSWDVHEGEPGNGDATGHGTSVAGVAGAMSDNGAGVAGVAWESPILSVRATGSRGTATSRDIAAGILWAQGSGAKVINVSFAPLWSNSVVRAAAEHAFNRGSLVVISAGNDGGFTTNRGYDEALFVGAVTGSGGLASFSDRGPFVDVVAPGTAIRTTTSDGSYGLVNGTSFAAPIVSGVAALCWSVNPDLRPSSITDILSASAVDLGDEGFDDKFGHGLVDAAAAVELALETTELPDDAPPSVRVRRPSDGSTISGRAIVEARASDDDGIADVVLLIDEVAIATDTRTPYRFVIDTAVFGTGWHELAFVATDHSGHSATSRVIDVQFSVVDGTATGISIDIRSPAPGARVGASVTIQATVASDQGLATVEWLVDGQSQLVTPVSGRSSGISYTWRTAGYVRGAHLITIIVTSLRGEQGFGTIELVRR